MLQAVDHVQLAIPPGGEARARAFWHDLLGLPETPKPAELAGRGGCWFETDAIKVHCGVEDPFHAARKAHIAFRVDDVETLAERAGALGYETANDRQLPGHARVFIFDPFGNRLEFLQPLPPSPSWGGTGCEASRVEDADTSPSLLVSLSQCPTLTAPPSVPPHKGEGGINK